MQLFFCLFRQVMTIPYIIIYHTIFIFFFYNVRFSEFHFICSSTKEEYSDVSMFVIVFRDSAWARNDFRQMKRYQGRQKGTKISWLLLVTFPT